MDEQVWVKKSPHLGPTGMQATKQLRARECPDCAHVRCDEDCVCNCDAAHAEHEAAQLRAELEAEREAKEKAEANYRFMVERAAAQTLDGYRELGARAASAENALSDARASLAKVRADRDTMIATHDEVERELEAERALREGLEAELAKVERERDAAIADIGKLRAHFRAELKVMQRVNGAARAAVDEAWFYGGVSLAAAIRRKCAAMEGLPLVAPDGAVIEPSGCSECDAAGVRFNNGRGATTCDRLGSRIVAYGFDMPTTRPSECPLRGEKEAGNA